MRISSLNVGTFFFEISDPPYIKNNQARVNQVFNF